MSSIKSGGIGRLAKKVEDDLKVKQKGFTFNAFFQTVAFIVLIIFFSILSYRIAITKLEITGFKFADLSTLIIALFAIGLSASFYYMATKTSAKFHDHVIDFTQRTAEILGRIEERFGERMESISKGQDRLYSYFAPNPQQQEKIDKKKDELEAKTEEQDKMIQSLIEKASKTEGEKGKLGKQLEKLEKEKANIATELKELKNAAKEEKVMVSKVKKLERMRTLRNSSRHLRKSQIEGELQNVGDSGELDKWILRWHRRGWSAALLETIIEDSDNIPSGEVERVSIVLGEADT